MDQEYEFEETAQRYLILGDPKQDFPNGPLRVKKVEAKTSASGKTFPVLTLEDAKGNSYDCAAFPRDVQPCVKEWGKKPSAWGAVEFTIVKGTTRRCIIPCDQQPEIEEQPIGD